MGGSCFPEEVENRDQDATSRDRFDPRAAQALTRGIEMSDDLELIRGSGNVFHDFGHANAEVEQLKAILAARIIAVLDQRSMTVRQAKEATGFAAADFSRIRQAKLDRFTIDRL